MLASACLAGVSACAGQPGPHGHPVALVLARGRDAQDQPWKLVVSDRRGARLSLLLESPSGHVYSGGVGFAAGPAAGFWVEGSGPGRSDFFYGPAPAAAVTVRMSAAGYAPILLRASPLPSRPGLPRGRFFITQPPGPPGVEWRVTLLDASGHRVPFADF